MRRSGLIVSLVFTCIAALGGCDDSEVPPDGGSICGGIAGFACGAGEYCDFPAGARCGAADQTGTCEEKPQVCYQIYAPVCGCDDRTYANDCEAAAKGVSVARTGPC